MRFPLSLVIVALALATTAKAQTTDGPSITVSGTAVTSVTPDLMDWRLSVTTRGDVPVDVAREHAEQVEELLDYLKEADIEEESLQTARMSLSENWQRQGGRNVMEGYLATTEVSFGLLDFDEYQLIWLGLAELSSVSVDNVSYRHSKEIEYRNEARTKALVAAREKASSMAGVLDAEAGRPLQITEISRGGGSFISANRYNIQSQIADIRSTSMLAPGMIDITAEVKVTFELTFPADR